MVNDFFPGEIFLNTGDGVQRITAEEYGSDLPQPAPLFVECLRDKKPMPFPVEDAVALSRLMEAAYKSAATGEAAAY